FACTRTASSVSHCPTCTILSSVSLSYADEIERDRQSLPTRRSSDLSARSNARCRPARYRPRNTFARARTGKRNVGRALAKVFRRSEEHTSELQSRVDLVCRPLLEKKTRTRQNRKLQPRHLPQDIGTT